MVYVFRISFVVFKTLLTFAEKGIEKGKFRINTEMQKCKNAKMQKCKNAKMQKYKGDIEKWKVEKFRL